MGRNRKGRQCGGYESKMERFVLQRKWQYELSKAVARSRQQHNRQVQQRERDRDASASSDVSRKRRVVRVDVVKALMNARLKDDQVERIKLKSAEHIASQLEQSAREQTHFSSLQDRCLYEIARTFDWYSATCAFTTEFFATFEPWMITRLSELTTAFKTLSDANVALLLLTPTDTLTLGFVRDERSLAPLLTQTERDQQRMAWQLPSLGSTASYQPQVESWDELDVDDVALVQTHDAVHLTRLELVSCAGLSVAFAEQLTLAHPFVAHVKVVDSFDAVDAAGGAALLQLIASWRHLETLHLSWCCWLTTEMLVTLAYVLLEPHSCGATLREFHVSDCFDVVDDYVRSVFAELHPHVRLTF